jgi:hypothetical protein
LYYINPLGAATNFSLSSSDRERAKSKNFLSPIFIFDAEKILISIQFIVVFLGGGWENGHRSRYRLDRSYKKQQNKEVD